LNRMTEMPECQKHWTQISLISQINAD